MQHRKKRLNRDGLPVDPNDWTPADWQDLHEAIEKVKRNVARRHKPCEEKPTPAPPAPNATT